MYDHILLPTDGSEGARRATEQALGLAETFDAHLHVLYVVDTATVSPDARSAMILDRLEDHGEQAVQAIADQAAERDVPVTTVVETGTPHRAIVAYADEHGVDLVVMGTHGRTGLDRYLLGSVTEKVVRTADAAVLTVRMPAAEE